MDSSCQDQPPLTQNSLVAVAACNQFVSRRMLQPVSNPGLHAFARSSIMGNVLAASRQSALKLAVIAVAVALLLQVACPAGVPMLARLGSPGPLSGCHDSDPQQSQPMQPASPGKAQKCCDRPGVFRPSLSLAQAGLPLGQIETTDSPALVSAPRLLMIVDDQQASPSPGQQVLRI